MDRRSPQDIQLGFTTDGDEFKVKYWQGIKACDRLQWELKWIPWGSSHLCFHKVGPHWAFQLSTGPNFQPKASRKFISERCPIFAAWKTHWPITFFFCSYSTLTIFLPQEYKTSCCSFSPTSQVNFSSEKKKGPELIWIKALLASTTFNLTVEHFAFTIKYKFKKSVSANSNLKKQVRHHCWDFVSFFYFTCSFERTRACILEQEN